MGITIPQEIAALGQWYEMDLSAAAFVDERRYLIPLLEEMAPVLMGFFPDGPLRLQIERDPETGRVEPMRVYTLWTGDPDKWMDARERLDEFDATWWDKRVKGLLRGQLSIDFRCLEPVK